MAKQVSINVKIDTKDGKKSIGDLNNEIKTTLTTLGDMEDASAALNEKLREVEVGTAEYEKLRKELIKVNTEIKNQELAMEALDNEQVASEIGSVVGGLTDMAGGFALVGASSKSMEEIVQTFAKVEAASKIVKGGIEAYQSGLKLMNSLSVVAAAAQARLAATQVAAGASSKVAAIGMRILNVVMNANPVFLLIAGITAIIGAFALFSSSSESAADSAERLNKELEIQKNKLDELYQLQKLQSDFNKKNSQLAVSQREIVLKSQIDALNAVTNKTKEENDKLKSLNNELYELEYNNVITLRDAKLQDSKLAEADAQARVEIIKKQVDAQSKVIREAQENNDQEAYDSAINTRRELIKEQNKLTIEIAKQQKERTFIVNEASLEQFKMSRELTVKLAQEEEKRKQDAIKAFKDRRKTILKELNDMISRQESAEAGLVDARIEQLDNLEEKELELADLAYGNEKQKLIDGAITREITALEEKFIKGRISEEQFQSERAIIVENGANNLLDVELELLNQKKIMLEEEKQAIRDRYAFEATFAKEQTDKILADALLSNIQHKKNLELLDAEDIKNEEDRAAKILEINKRYLQEEINAVKDSAKQQGDVLDAQYANDIDGLAENSEEKKRIDAEYYANKQQLANDTEMQIRQLEKETLEQADLNMSQKIDKWSQENAEMIAFVQETITTTIDLIGQVMEEQAARAAASREQEYEKESESLNAQLANREISQKQFDSKMALLDQKKEQRELAAKRKAFKQSKALQIVNAIMSTAQGVMAAFSSAAAIPIAGVALGPIMAGVAGALGAAQIGIIASQKFQAARGGVVPGIGPSNIDSVDALLAPGEMVINAQSAGMFPQTLSAINQAGGGVSLAPDTAPVQSSTGGAIFKDNEAQPTIKAVVVETDITDAQRRVSRIERSATF